MIKHFYSYIIETDTLLIELDSLEVTSEEKKQLEHLIDRNIHHVVIDTVLSYLSEDDKKTFLSHLHVANYDNVWKLLNAKIENAEEKIKESVSALKKELLDDIKTLKKEK